MLGYIVIGLYVLVSLVIALRLLWAMGWRFEDRDDALMVLCMAAIGPFFIVGLGLEAYGKDIDEIRELTVAEQAWLKEDDKDEEEEK